MIFGDFLTSELRFWTHYHRPENISASWRLAVLRRGMTDPPADVCGEESYSEF